MRIWWTGDISSAALHESIELAVFEGNRRAAAAHRKARPQHRRQADFAEPIAGLRDVVHGPAAGQIEADILHRLLKPLAALGLIDHIGIRADHLDAKLFEHAVARQIHRHVEPRLPAERRQQRIGPLLLDHLGHDLPGERLDIRPIRRRRIGHDRGRVRVHEHDLVTLFAQRFAGLRARVVELAGLPDDDWPGTDDQNLL